MLRPWSRLLAVVTMAGVTTLAVGCSGGSGGGTGAQVATTGKGIYRQFCATCHGSNGGGRIGPSLLEVAAKYPNVADQIAVVTAGRGGMPAWGTKLTTAEIGKVVEYTRTGL